MAFGSYFNLPTVLFNILFDKGTDEYAGVPVCFLLKFNRQVEVVIVIACSQIAVFLVRTAFTDQQTIFYIPLFRAIGFPSL